MFFLRRQPEPSLFGHCGTNSYYPQRSLFAPHRSVIIFKPENDATMNVEGQGTTNDKTTTDGGRVNQPQSQESITKSETERQAITYRIGRAYVTEDNDKFTVSIDLPGVKADNVKIEEQEEVLCITAERKSGDQLLSKFSQSIAIDEKSVDASSIEAELVDGVLTVTMKKKTEQKAEPNKPISIAVQAADPTPEAEGENKYVDISVDLPGVKPANLKLEYKDEELLIEAERKLGNGNSSKFRRVLTVQEKLIDVSGFEAFLMDGILTIRVPRKEKPAAKSISVRTPASVTRDVTKEQSEMEVTVETVENEE